MGVENNAGKKVYGTKLEVSVRGGEITIARSCEPQKYITNHNFCRSKSALGNLSEPGRPFEEGRKQITAL